MAERPIKLPVAGLTPFTTIDYPGHLAAVIFCQGCSWHCRYCHNAALRPFKPGAIPWEEVRRKLEARSGWLDAVVFSGGEPTAHPHLPKAITEMKSLGYKVGLHTAGIHPAAFQRVLPLVDWVGLDIKAPFNPLYDFITGFPGAGHLAFESLLILLASDTPYQLRTTMDPRFLAYTDIWEINRMLDERGVPPVIIQQVRTHEEATSIFNS